VRVDIEDAQGNALADATEMSYLHGGYGQILPALEAALDGKGMGETVHLQLEPEQAFGDYDAELVRVEPAQRYGEGITPGMQVEEDERLYTVTDVAAGKVVLDGNHPFAGMALRFSVVILAIRAASQEERSRGVSSP